MDAERHHNDFTMSDVIHVWLSDDELRRLRHDAALASCHGIRVPALDEFLETTERT